MAGSVGPASLPEVEFRLFVKGRRAENEQDTNTKVLDIDDARTEVVAQQTIQIDCLSVSRIRVIYNADYDTDGPDVYTFCAYTLNTGI